MIETCGRAVSPSDTREITGIKDSLVLFSIESFSEQAINPAAFKE